jgi:hypothetical protein
MPNLMRAADTDGNGNQDVVVQTAGNTITVLYGDGQGHLGAPMACTLPGFNTFEVADFNEDGKADVIVPIQGGAVLLFGK